MKDFPLEKVSQVTHLSMDQLMELIQLIKGGERVSIWWTMGINQSHNAVRAAQSIINLQLLLGNYGKPGTKWEKIAENRLAWHDMNPEAVDNR